jgi:hypothetical protein
VESPPFLLDGANPIDSLGSVAHASQSFLFTKDLRGFWPGVQSGLGYTLVFTVLDDRPSHKFKVVGLQTC